MQAASFNVYIPAICERISHFKKIGNVLTYFLDYELGEPYFGLHE